MCEASSVVGAFRGGEFGPGFSSHEVMRISGGPHYSRVPQQFLDSLK